MGNGEDMRKKNGCPSSELSRLLRPNVDQMQQLGYNPHAQLLVQNSSQVDQPLDFSTKRAPGNNGLLHPSDRFSPSMQSPLNLTPEFPSHIARQLISPPSPVFSDNGSTLNNSEPDIGLPNQVRSESTPNKVSSMMLPCLPQLGGFGLNSMLQEALGGNAMERFSELTGNNGGLLTTVPTSMNNLPSMGNLLNNTPTTSSDPRKPFKYTRPFKAYPRDPLSVPLGYYGMPLQLPLPPEAVANQTILSSASDQAYLQFREQMLATRRSSDGPKRPVSGKMNGSSGSSGAHGSNSDGESNGPSNNSFRSPHHLQMQMSHVDDSSNSSDDKMCNTVGTSSGLMSDEALSANAANVEAIRMQMGLQLSQYQQLHGRKRSRALPEELKDEAYWERRRKNNEAAKRSRDARRAKEDEIAIRAAFLEQENLKLRVELSALKSETAKLRCLMYSN